MSDRTAKLKQRLTRNWPKGQQLIRTLGPKPAEQVFDLILANGYVKPQIENTKQSDEAVLKIVDLYLDRELENVARTGTTLGSLASKLSAGSLAPVAVNNAMPANAYGAAPGDSDAMKAAKWVNRASTTQKSAGSLTETSNIITMAVAARTPMNTLSGIDYINKLLLRHGGRSEPRGPVVLPMASPLPSSPGGRRMLEIAVQYLTTSTPGAAGCAWRDLACYLLGAVIGCHGFSDANGRTARVLYSICWIQSGAAFVGISANAESQLTGLPSAV